MDAGTKSFSGFVTGRHTFEVPDYQRNYSWTKSELKDLWRDLHDSLDRNKEHFFGTFLLREQQDSQAYDIIDGQQRLTSLLLLLNEMSNQWREYDEEAADEIKQWYIASRNGYKIQLMGDDKRFFKEYILGGLSDGSSGAYPEETITASQGRLKKAKKFFKDEFKKRKEESTQEEFEDYCSQLKQKIEKDLELMVYPVDSEAEAVRIFEVVNDRGKDLSQLEKAKSFLMHRLYLALPEDDQEKLLEEHLATIRDHFKDIYQLIDDINDHDDAPNFSEDRIQRYHYILWDTEWTTSRNSRYYQNHLTYLKERFQEYPRDEVIDEILRYTEELRDSFHAIKTIVTQSVENDRIEERLTRLNVLGTLGNFYPLLIAAWLKHDKEDVFTANELVELLDGMESFIFRVYSVQQRRGNTGRTKFYRLARAVHQGETDARKAINEVGDHINYYCDDDALRKVFNQNEIYTYYGDGRKDELRYLLYFYEKHLEADMEGLNFDLRAIVKNEGKNITIEHIWPKSTNRLNLSEEEKQRHAEHKHDLGNLALMTWSWNSGEQDKPFTDKRERYSQSKIRMLNNVAKEEEWGADKITVREEDMVDFIVQCWPDTSLKGKVNSLN